jgi:hypothetical protein
MITTDTSKQRISSNYYAVVWRERTALMRKELFSSSLTPMKRHDEPLGFAMSGMILYCKMLVQPSCFINAGLRVLCLVDSTLSLCINACPQT